jgi:hypothetical protein
LADTDTDAQADVTVITVEQTFEQLGTGAGSQAACQRMRSQI